MPRICDVCGKGPVAGSSIVRHGREKKKGGIGLHITGVSKRWFRPNLHRIRVRANGGGVSRRLVCASCIKAGKVNKA
jgi:large subunit ribosomal protein L28